jgi:ferritin
MALSEKMLSGLTDQITMELSASHSYLAMSAWFESQSLPGMATWMQLQSEEERTHALKFFDFVVDRDEDVVLGSIEAPRSVFESSLEVFTQALAQEKDVTAAINRLYTIANAEGDFEAIPLITWFINEQVEEEASVDQVVEDLRRAGDDPQVLLMLDRELGARTAEA